MGGGLPAGLNRMGGTGRVFLVTCLFLIAVAGRSWVGAVEAFKIAVIGDQQVPVNNTNYYTSFTAQTDWLAANAQAEKIRFVTQVGDIVEHGDDLAEWGRAEGAMATLDSGVNADGGTGIPWNVVYGNHEVDTTEPGTDPAGARANRFREYFGSNGTATHRYEGQVGFGGVSSNDLNTYHIVKSSDAPDAREYLMLGLEYDVPGHPPGSVVAEEDRPAFDAIAWAQGIIDAHPGMPTIITTHVFEGSKFGPPNNPYHSGPGRNSQLEIFDKLVKDNRQIFLVLSGHTSQDTHQVKQNSAGLDVLQMVTDYNKVLPNGGDGFMRLIELDEDAGEVRVRTFTPGVPQNDTPRYRTDSDSEFTLQMDWEARFDAEVTDPPDPPDPVPGQSSLIAHWKSDEGQGIAAADSSSNGNTATHAGAAGSWIAGKNGGAYQLGGGTSRFEVADSSDLQVTGAVTVSAWVKPFGASQFGVIAGVDQVGGTANDMYSLKTTNSAGDRLNWQVTGPGTNVNLVSLSTLDELSNGGTDWVHVVGVYDPGGFAGLYVNGALDVSTTTVPSSIQSKTTPFQIGHNASDSGNNALQAAVDDIQIYEGALGATEVLYLFNNPGGALPVEGPEVEMEEMCLCSPDVFLLIWRERSDIGAVYTLHESTTLLDGSWNQSDVTPADAADQSGLPPGYTRREAVIPIDTSRKFLRVVGTLP